MKSMCSEPSLKIDTLLSDSIAAVSKIWRRASSFSSHSRGEAPEDHSPRR